MGKEFETMTDYALKLVGAQVGAGLGRAVGAGSSLVAAAAGSEEKRHGKRRQGKVTCPIFKVIFRTLNAGCEESIRAIILTIMASFYTAWLLRSRPCQAVV